MGRLGIHALNPTFIFGGANDGVYVGSEDRTVFWKLIPGGIFFFEAP